MEYDFTPIDWEEMRVGYNTIKGTNFKTIKEFLTVVYYKHKNVERMGEELGCSTTPIYTIMKKYNIPLVPKGGHRPSKHLWTILTTLSMKEIENMTSREIANATEVPISTVSFLLTDLDIKFIKRGNGSGWKGLKEAILAIPKEELAGMTVEKISNRVGACLEYTRKVLKRNNLPYMTYGRGRPSKEFPLNKSWRSNNV